MSTFHPSQLQRDNEFFITIKRYTERLTQEKNISLHYLQTINKLNLQLTAKDETIQKLIRQNQELKEKLSLYEQVMTRSRILINTGGNKKNFENHSTMAVNQIGRSFSPPNNYANSKISVLIDKQKFTESFLQTRNELDYLRQYDQQEYQKLQSRIQNQKHSIIIREGDPFWKSEQRILTDKILEESQAQLKFFPIFQDFVIIKPTENTNSSPQNLHDLKVLFSLSDEEIKKGNKIFESISTYLCHNSGSSWIPQEYKTQIVLGPSTATSQSLTANSSTSISIQPPPLSFDPIFMYLSNSAQTLQPIVYSHKNSVQQQISPIYQEFNPSLYYFGICYKSHCLEYINGKLHKIPLVYCFVTRYPFLTYWRELLELIVERLNIKNEKEFNIFREELRIMKQKSIDKHFGMFVQLTQNEMNNHLNMSRQANEFMNFQFDLLQKHITWRKINPKALLKPRMQQMDRLQRKRSTTTTDIRFTNSNTSYSIMTPVNLLPIGSLIENIIPSIILSELSSTFNSYNIELIVDVLLLLMLEIPIAIISRHESLLQKFMLYFVYIIKPLKYPFPIIFNLPLNMSVVLESPFPSFLGITDPIIIEPYMFERTVFDLDEKVAKSWPNIDFYNQSRECVMKWVHKAVEHVDREVGKLEKINDIVRLLITSSKYYPQELKELRTYRKYFKKTEIWHLYNHAQQEKNPKMGHS